MPLTLENSDVDTSDKHKVVNISENFHKNLKWPPHYSVYSGARGKLVLTKSEVENNSKPQVIHTRLLVIFLGGKNCCCKGGDGFHDDGYSILQSLIINPNKQLSLEYLLP